MLVGHLPVGNFGEGLSLLAVLLVALFLVVQRRGPLIALGAVVMPLAFGLTLSASVLKGGAQPLPAILQSVWLPVHVLLALLGDAVFAIACSASVLYLIQERRLKTHRGRGVLRQLPSLERLDQVSHTCLKWGLILLTLAIVTGIVWAHEAWGRGDWLGDPKLLFSLLVWALYTDPAPGPHDGRVARPLGGAAHHRGLRGHRRVAGERQPARARPPRRSVLT